MRLGTASVRSALGDVPGLTDRDIQESLYYYYCDVEKTVDYLLKKMAPKEEKKKKTKGGSLFLPCLDMAGAKRHFGLAGSRSEDDFGGASPSEMVVYGTRANTATLDLYIVSERLSLPATRCDKLFDMKDFWKDMSWFNVPQERQATFIAPFQPRGGLLGGSSDAAPMMSKLQILAAARKKKAGEQMKGAGVEEVTKPMEGLSLCNITNATRTQGGSPQPASSPAPGTQQKENPRMYPRLKRKDSSPHNKTPRPQTPAQEIEQPHSPPRQPKPKVETAAPSAFASTMFGGGHSSARQPAMSMFSLPLPMPKEDDKTVQPTDAFAGPSPDDVVKAAQSKGSAARHGHL